MVTQEIKRNSWAKFLRQFNAANQYRHAELNIIDERKREKKTIPLEDRPFLGMVLEKRGRFIDGIQLMTANDDPEHLAEPVVTLKDPAKIILEKDAQGRDMTVTVVSSDGIKASLELGSHDEQLPVQLVQKVAYNLYERRGFEHGHDREDWLTAEQKVKDTELNFVR